ncbi:hypothetical protein GH714_006711 [Hevea brasiliensis]|uniref:Uncharacterized protein n=1 Tax=Hevea brasiliensis TaxID=3981 RepID=A0A6A6N0L3_HEVBR|nr:hypothetical protein GH714_006711 [Hevea brasiliensis]
MEDSTTMTIEFLRARLLSERSVSRSARQRADELAKRVAELQEQLTIVSLQRMKAEKATADVLAILDGNGISHISETFDSSSEQDTCECKVGNRSPKEEENSVNLEMRNNEAEELSGSDLDFSTVTARSLSWKGRKDSPRYLENTRVHLQEDGLFLLLSVSEELKANPVKVDALEDEVATTPDNFPNCPDVEPGMLEGIDSCDPGNRSDVTEEGYEIKAPAKLPAMTVASQTQEVRSEVEDLSKIQPSGFIPSSHVDVSRLEERENSSTSVSKSSTQDFAFPMVQGKQNQGILGNNYHLPSQIPHNDSVSHGSYDSPGGQNMPSFPSNTSNSLSKMKASEGENELYALVPASDGWVCWRHLKKQGNHCNRELTDCR